MDGYGDENACSLVPVGVLYFLGVSCLGLRSLCLHSQPTFRVALDQGTSKEGVKKSHGSLGNSRCMLSCS